MMMKISKQQKGASSVLLVLAILKRKDTYAYQIAQELNTLSLGQIKCQAASLYPVLKKLESRKLIKSNWNVKDFDRPRKYYQLLEKGNEELDGLIIEMKIVPQIIEKILKIEI